jgi:hypothetical protein
MITECFAVGLLLVRMLCDLFKPRPRLSDSSGADDPIYE